MGTNEQLIYNKTASRNAIRCLLEMEDLENTPKFGELKIEYEETKRYTLVDTSKDIDSVFFTCKATFLLSLIIDKFDEDLYSFDKELCLKMKENMNFATKFDLINDSKGEYANFKGDISFFENDYLTKNNQLYAYYNEFEILTTEETNEIFDKVLFNEKISDKVAIKKIENINGVEISFYYLADSIVNLNSQLNNHDSNISFFKEKIPGNVLNAIKTTNGFDNIITLDIGSWTNSESHSRALAYADYYNGSIVIKDSYFKDAVIHELGHHFDWLGKSGIGVFGLYPDYSILNIGKWDLLANKYAEKIESIRIDSNTKGGYSSDSMKEIPAEFYAEAFRMYYYSPETRAALPEQIRKALESEINKFANG